MTYLRGRKLWEYPEELLLVLCDSCHGDRQVHDEEAKLEFSRMLARMDSWHVYELSKALRRTNDGGDHRPKVWDAHRSIVEAIDESNPRRSRA